MDAGLQAIVEWVKESLEETLADIDDDETDVPLVPIIPETQQGIEHEDVVNMLRSLGLKSPRENMVGLLTLSSPGDSGGLNLITLNKLKRPTKSKSIFV
jgi:hypothetical protein